MSESDPTIARRLGQFVSGCSVLAVTFGLWVLAGWTLHIQIVKSILPGQIAVKANTAVCFILIGFALWMLRKEQPSGAAAWRLAAKTAAIIVSVVGLLSFQEFAFGWDLGIDHLLFVAGAEDIPGSVRPGLMSPIASWGFFLLGSTLLLLDAKTRLGRWGAQLLPSGVAIAAMFGILDFVLDANTTHTYISPATASVLFLVGFGFMFSRTQWGLGELVASVGVGGALTRRLLPAAILAPLAIGWLRWKGQSAGLYSDWTGVALMTVVSIVLLASLTAWTGFTVDRGERERQRTEQERNASEERFRLLLDGVKDYAIYMLDPDGNVISWNAGAENVKGYRAEEILGQHFSCFYTASDRENGKPKQELEQAISLGRIEGLGERLRKNGLAFWANFVIAPLRDESGKLRGFSKVVRDVTERKRAEEKLRTASLYARSLIEASLDPLVTISREGKITDVNQATEKVTGVSRAQLIGSDFSNYFTEPESARRGYEQVFAQGAVQDYPLAIRHASGRVIDVLYNAAVFRNEAGEIEGVFAAARDVTERKRAEEKIRNLNQELEKRVQERTAQLHESERRVRRKLESILSPEGNLERLELADLLDIPALQSLAEEFYELAHIPMFILDLKGNPVVAAGWQEICTKFHRANPEACKNCRESDGELSTGVAPGEFKLYKCKNNLWDVVTPIMVGGQHVGNLFSGQFFFTDETVDQAMFRSQARKYGFDEPEYLAALDRVPRLSRKEVEIGMTFYTRLAQLLSQLSYSGIKLARSASQIGRANAELAASVKELEAFTYSVSHDLRAPLRHISGFSKMLAEEFGSSLPPDAQHHVERIQEGTRRMGVLVDDLLNLARVGRRDLSLRVSGLKSIVDEVTSELVPECGERQIEWKISELPFVECDPGLMKQVFQNLLSNAVKFTRPRSHAVIEVGLNNERGIPAVFVRDNGVGFSMKYADKLFGVFQRLHRVEDFEGTGVGLATVQRIVQKHGGRIWADAELDKGATFYFTLGSSEKTELKPKTAVAGGQE
jgi:PAS domain S-box-containing protein